MAVSARVLTSIPRRPPLDVHGAPAESAQLGEATKPPKAGAFRLFLRSLGWLAAGLLLALRLIWDTLRGRRSWRNLGRRLRQMFEESGDAGAKLGQQLSLRVDLFPYEVCEELAKIRGDVTPLDLDYVVATIEGAAKAPLAVVFELFDPEPIHTGMTTSVYAGVLRGGERVAVKVRRPGVAERMAVDLRCVEWFTYVPETLTFVRPGFFRQLRDGLRQIAADETDLAREARYQRIFRRWAKKARIEWLSAPKVYTSLSNADVMVSEYVDGILASELLTFVENDDQRALRDLAELGITPCRIARRIFRAQFWCYFEALFFHAEPYATDVILQRGGKVVFLDFGTSGTVTRGLRQNHEELLARALANDAAGMAEVALYILAPLPHIDIYELRKSLEVHFHHYLFALRDRRSRWWEHAPVGIWFAIIQAAREMNVPVRAEVMRLARAALLYDGISFRLADLRFAREYRRYQRQAVHRRARRIERRMEKSSPREVRHRMTVFGAHMQRFGRKAAWTADAIAQDRPVEITATIKKAAYAFRALLHFIVKTAAIGAVGAAVYPFVETEPGTTLLSFVFTNPIVLLLVVINALIMVRRIALRLDERDTQSYGSSDNHSLVNPVSPW